MTRSPSAAKRRAMALPIPEEAPVTMATRSLSLNVLFLRGAGRAVDGPENSSGLTIIGTALRIQSEPWYASRLGQVPADAASLHVRNIRVVYEKQFLRTIPRNDKPLPLLRTVSTKRAPVSLTSLSLQLELPHETDEGQRSDTPPRAPDVWPSFRSRAIPDRRLNRCRAQCRDRDVPCDAGVCA